MNSAGKLLIATNNKGKVREYRELLRELPHQLVAPAELGITDTIEESGTTFEENARLKALFYARRSGLLTLADDSGLEIDELGGKPGTMSARYAGEGASDLDKIRLVLTELKDVPLEKRTARFRCVIAIAEPGGKVSVFYGECPGIIIDEPRGEWGFGYDPIFYLPEFGNTMAELPPELKNRISHRGQAARKAVEFLKRSGFSSPSMGSQSQP